MPPRPGGKGAGVLGPVDGKAGALGPLTGGKLGGSPPVPKLVCVLVGVDGEAKGLGFVGGTIGSG